MGRGRGNSNAYVDRYVYRHRQRLNVIVVVPGKVRPRLLSGGKPTKRLTRLVATVQQARPVIDTFKRMVETVEADPTPVDRETLEARVREQMAHELTGNTNGPTARELERQALIRQGLAFKRAMDAASPERRSELSLIATEQAEILRDYYAEPEAADTLYGVAHGDVPITLHIDAWFAENDFAGRTMDERRAAIKEFSNWMESEKFEPTVQAVNDLVAGRYKQATLVGKMKTATANKRLSSLKTYWSWLIANGHAKGANPWAGKSLSRSRRASAADTDMRPFTTEELERLFTEGKPDQLMHDACALALLTGARREELFKLRPGDYKDDALHIRNGKSKAARRMVPIHPLLKPIVERLCKAKGEYLLASVGAETGSRPRADAFGKRFVRHRRAVKVGALSGRSDCDFHSFRRTFATLCEQAGAAENLVARIIGHEIGTMTFGHYSGGASLEQLRTVVESITLPEKVEATITGKGKN